MQQKTKQMEPETSSLDHIQLCATNCNEIWPNSTHLKGPSKLSRSPLFLCYAFKNFDLRESSSEPDFQGPLLSILPTRIIKESWRKSGQANLLCWSEQRTTGRGRRSGHLLWLLLLFLAFLVIHQRFVISG